jgi:acyl-[acyl-carrier-protein]-phospholipid O-acyltransferase/long-chain-fatty-acid--[acyl-carrier-protein] ligase
VITRPDESKGERLICVTNEPRLKLEDVRAVIRDKGFSNLCQPREIISVKEIPKLGSGKVNHRKLVEQVERKGEG